MTLEIIMLSEINQAQRVKYHMFCSVVEPSPKTMMMMMIMGCKCERRTVWGTSKGGKKGKETEG
jgi:hypothetical protein